jgi:hypothetical protein
VVGHEVDDHAEPQLVSPGEEGVEVRERAEQRVDVAVVADVVARVALRRRVERREPERVHSQVREVLQTGGDARQVPDAVAVGVGPRAGIDLIDDGVAPPALGHASPPR